MKNYQRKYKLDQYSLDMIRANARYVGKVFDAETYVATLPHAIVTYYVDKSIITVNYDLK